MNFSSPTFLFYFLPVFLSLYWLLPVSLRPWLLMVGSFIFYIWGDTLYTLLILVVLIVNYLLAQRLLKAEKGGLKSKRLMALGLLVNIGLLAAIKLYAAYEHVLITTLLIPISPGLAQELGWLAYVPSGYSFITFQALALMFDIQKGRIQTGTPARLNPLHFILYLMMFPKVIAGPITRFGELEPQLKAPKVNIDQVTAGMGRFIIGLAKKTLIADQLAPVVNAVFALDSSQLTTAYAWLGLIGFSLQLYFDFSGYTDMALGIGQMLGLKLPENFDSPYIATSIANFWRRWHISLSNWFRDYLFYPLERIRRGKTNYWQYGNILIVFLATGLWHGVTINFIIWGLLHGAAIAYENSPLGGWLKKSWIGIQHLYALFIILLGWVFFRSGSLSQAMTTLRALTGFESATSPIPFERLPITGGLFWIALIAGLILCLPVGEWLSGRIRQTESTLGLSFLIGQTGSKLALIALLILSLVLIAGAGFQAALYARF